MTTKVGQRDYIEVSRLLIEWVKQTVENPKVIGMYRDKALR